MTLIASGIYFMKYIDYLLRIALVWIHFDTALMAESQTIRQTSYSEAAKKTVSNQLDSLNGELNGFHENIWPHEAKKLRKTIAKVRAYFDIFIYSYPKRGEEDIWKDGRGLLDTGYGLVGSFKDVFDRLEKPIEEVEPQDYDYQEVESLRSKILLWIKRYRKFFYDRKNELYFSHPRKKTAQVRKHSDLPKYYWRIASFVPKLSQDNSAILYKLIEELLASCKNSHRKVQKIRDILDPENQKNMHEFRKKLRAIIKLNIYFNGLLSKKILNSEAYRNLEQLVDRYGQIGRAHV